MRSFLILNILFLIYCVDGDHVDKYRKPSIRQEPLPTVITPFEYDLKLTPYLDVEDVSKAFTFDGEISILLQASDDNVNKIVMHSKFITDVREINPSADIKIDDIQMESEDLLVLTLSRALVKAQNYTFSLSYKGVLQEDMTGFYRSSYVENGITKWLATTQFQSNDARKAFPCFDEPYYKSIFKISIMCPENYTCLSNMPEQNKEGNLVKFYQTPPMSSYIVAFIVSQLVPIRITDDNADKHFGIWARPDSVSMGDLAFEVGPKIVAEFDEYLGVKYYEMNENIKMDHVAISDFWPGAMENWGLITYKESYLMYHNAESSVRYRQLTTGVMAHEIAHMWFGNLVTCRYWSHTWLNEAFAGFFQHYITEKVEEFGMNDQFILANVHSTLLGDMKVSSATNYEASARKGAAVIRMIEHLIGPDSFASGLNHYLTTNAYKTVTPKELYDSLDEKSDLSWLNTTVNEVMGSWISQAGYPLLTVSVDQATGKVSLEQKNFNKEHTDNTETFPIPLTCAYEKNPYFNDTKSEFIMTNQKAELLLPESPGWVIFNIQQTGLYRIMYDNATWDLLTNLLRNDRNKVHRYNRAQIVDDAFNLAREGIMDYSRMLDIIKYLELETEYAPWSAAYSGLSYLRIRFSNIIKVSKPFDDYLVKMMNSVIENVGLNVNRDDSNLIKIFRINTLNLACELQHGGCVESSILRFNQLTQNGTSVQPDLREHVYCNALRYGDENSFDFLWKRYVIENVITEKVVILGALGCTRKQNKVMELLSMTIDTESVIRDQDRMNAYNSALNGNVENANTVLEFIVNNTNAIKSVYGSARLNTMFINLSSRLSDKGLSDFEEYLTTNTDLTAEEKSNGMSALANAQREMAWAEEKSDEITEWLKKNSAGSSEAAFTLVLFASLYSIIINYI